MACALRGLNVEVDKIGQADGAREESHSPALYFERDGSDSVLQGTLVIYVHDETVHTVLR
jgi:hypothetical protein